ncbi:MAG: hypothetical protein F6K42_00595 [Leptolyngbya sp. SIO1D8]|nr:hypothetical protein [Leptolyngbya sp. SIO1D8]
MKAGFNFNQVLIAVLMIAGLIAMGAIFTQYPGLIEMQCSTSGCRFVIDGRRS